MADGPDGKWEDGWQDGRMVLTTTHEIRTKGQGDAHDLTRLVERALADSGLGEGLATVSVIGSTAGITTIEFEPGAVSDLDALFERLAPRHADYRHHLRWHDDNGSSHVRAALLGPSVSIPFSGRKLMLGTWQQIALFEFDTGPRQRQVTVQLLGE
jgi:secondary thiamine-phosphate synthase enzyme